MESAFDERNSTSDRVGGGAGVATAPADEAALLRQARDAFRFGPDGRLLLAPNRARVVTTPAPASSLAAARRLISDDPVLDECFEVAFELDVVDSASTTSSAPASDGATEDVSGVDTGVDRFRVRGEGDGADLETPAGISGPASSGVGHATISPDESETSNGSGTPNESEARNGSGSSDGAEAQNGSSAANGSSPNGLVGSLAETGPTTGEPMSGSLGAGAPVAEPATGRHADGPARKGRPMLEWPEAIDLAFRTDAPPTPATSTGALASALNSSPEVEVAFAESLGSADAPMGVFRWPSGTVRFANAALDEWMRPNGSTERTLVSMLDEWSQAHFLVRIVPQLLRQGRWRGQLTMANDERTEPMLVTLVAHEDGVGDTDAVSLFAMPVAPLPPSPSAPPAAATRSGTGAVRLETLASGSPDQLFSALVQHISDLIVVTDSHGRITFASPAAEALLGLAAAFDGVRPNLLAILHPDSRPTTLAALARQPDQGALPPHPMRVLGVDGSWRDLSGVLTDLTSAPAIGGYVLNARDVTDAVRFEQSITDRAFTDELTGLANRVRLLDRLEGIAQTATQRCTLVVLGLDHLRRIEAEHGPAGVETVLATVGRTLASSVGAIDPEALAARLQGDEFAVLVPGVDDAGDAFGIAGQLRLALGVPIGLGGTTVTVRASMGVATTAALGADRAFDEILARADLAMREAKAQGRDRAVGYDARLAHRLQHRRGIDQQLRRAIESDGLSIQYQPIVDLASSRVVGAEALLRVRDDVGELLSPAAFVEAAESSGLISRLGSAVLRTTCEQAAGLDLSSGGFPISVNVSPRQIADPDFARRVLSILGETGLAPRQLSLEITEGAFVGRDDASETNIISLRDEGVRIGLDEFGGDASLGYLRRFPLDFVKIDRRLIAGLGANYVDGTIVRATIELAHKLGLVTVAVGVEHDEQHHRLEQLGCDRAQGFLFGAAVSAAELAGLVDRRR